MESETIVRCNNCEEDLLVGGEEEMILSASGVSFPLNDFIRNGVAMATCPRCKINNIVPIGLTIPRGAFDRWSHR